MVGDSTHMLNFLLDSGATQHICGDLSMFKEIKEIPRCEVETANGSLEYSQMGHVVITLENGLKVNLKDVVYWPGAPLLISVAQLTNRGLNVEFFVEKAVISRNGETIYESRRQGNTYTIQLLQKAQKCYVSADTWHRRLNHCGKEKLKLTLGPRLDKEDVEKFFEKTCKGCAEGKFHRDPVRKKPATVREPLHTLVADSMGPYSESITKKRGALIVADVGSQYIWFIPFYRKRDVPKLFISLLRRIEREFPQKIKVVRTDNGREFINAALDGYLLKKGIKHEKTIPYIHEMNGRIENSIRMVLEGTRSLLFDSGLGEQYWTYAGACATFCYNLMKKTTDHVSPREYLYGNGFDLNKLRVFGSIGYAHLSRERRKKLHRNSIEVRFLGYAMDSIGYIVQNMKTKRIFYSRSLICDDSQLPEKNNLLGATGETKDGNDTIILHNDENQTEILQEIESNEENED